MTLKKICAIYALLVGISMILVWAGYFATGSVMGIKPSAPGLMFHIAAEFATSFALIAAAIGMLANRKWGRDIYFLGLGLLAYALINSPGYYIAGGGNFIIAVFAGSFVFTVAFAVAGLHLKD
jgi:hypothetical protein